jgi:hypothetical protein
MRNKHECATVAVGLGKLPSTVNWVAVILPVSSSCSGFKRALTARGASTRDTFQTGVESYPCAQTAR